MDFVQFQVVEIRILYSVVPKIICRLYIIDKQESVADLKKYFGVYSHHPDKPCEY